MRTVVRYLSLLILLVVTTMTAHASSTEHNIELTIDNPQQIQKLTHLVSIYNRVGNKVMAVASDQQLANLEKAGFSYTIIPGPKEQPPVRMSAGAEEATAWDAYPTYGDYVAMMYAFQTNYPNICRTYDIGNTVLGRDLLVVKISDNPDAEEAEPEVLYTSSMHGDETTGYILTLRLIDSLLSSYGSDARITKMIDSMEIWINPLANPDGTYRNDDNSVSGATRYNWNNVDLNRNYPDPDEGPHPDGNAWQIETMAMMDFADAHSFVLSANFHGGAEVVNYPWDTWPRRHPDNQWFIDLSRTYADSTHFYGPSGYMNDLNNGITDGWDWYTISGGRQDYMNYYHGCREVTIELSSTKLLPGTSLPLYWKYNRVSLITYLEQALYGIRGVVTDAVTSNPVAATINVLNHDKAADSSQVYTDPDVGDYCRMIQAGTYDVEYGAEGYYPDTVYGISATDYQATFVDVQLQPIPSEPIFAVVSNTEKTVNPGDTSEVYIEIANNGGAASSSTYGVLMSADPLVTITVDSVDYPDLSAYGGMGSASVPFEFEVDTTCPVGHTVDFDLINGAAGGFADTGSFSLIVGQPIEPFETGDFSAMAWQFGGNADWAIDAAHSHEGSYSARSGVILSSQTSEVEVTLDGCRDGSISFWYKTSSESGGDFLNFYIDDSLNNSWSGEIDWAEATFPVSSGSHTFRWEYAKDGSLSSGSDRVWLDLVHFPVVDPPPPLACGDVTGSGGGPDIADLTYLVSYMFKSGPAPVYYDLGDVNGVGGIDIADVTYLVSFMFKGGPALLCP